MNGSWIHPESGNWNPLEKESDQYKEQMEQDIFHFIDSWKPKPAEEHETKRRWSEEDEDGRNGSKD